jgi:chromosome segregation ATPase
MDKMFKLDTLYPVRSATSGNKGWYMIASQRLVTLISTLLVTSLLLMATHAHAKTIKCWKNKNGIRECGRTVPPEYSQTRIEIVNERGLVVDVIEAAKTQEELAIEREREELRRLREEERKEQARLDSILLNTYTTERDLILARDNNLKAAQGQIDISKGNLKLLEDNLNDLQEQAANHERAGRQPPKKLIEEINTLAGQINKKQEIIKDKETALEELEQRFARDLKRFRELKSGRN